MVSTSRRFHGVHRSRVSTLLIDTPTGDAPRAAAFWSAVTGSPLSCTTGEPQYTGLRDAVPGLVVAVQAVDDVARYHLDVETDDVAAEVARLVGLGAGEVSTWAGCHTLRTPGGHLLCVIPVHSDPAEFLARAHVWA